MFKSICIMIVMLVSLCGCFGTNIEIHSLGPVYLNMPMDVNDNDDTSVDFPY